MIMEMRKSIPSNVEVVIGKRMERSKASLGQAKVEHTGSLPSSPDSSLIIGTADCIAGTNGKMIISYARSRIWKHGERLSRHAELYSDFHDDLGQDVLCDCTQNSY
jgi:hypothetical protein